MCFLFEFVIYNSIISCCSPPYINAPTAVLSCETRHCDKLKRQHVFFISLLIRQVWSETLSCHKSSKKIILCVQYAMAPVAPVAR